MMSLSLSTGDGDARLGIVKPHGRCNENADGVLDTNKLARKPKRNFVIKYDDDVFIGEKIIKV